MSLYRKFEPANDLAPFLARLWTYEAAGVEAEQTIVPDGHPELVIHLATPYRERGEPLPQPRMIFVGQLNRPLTLVASGPVSIVGARFHPFGARAFVKGPMDITTDRRLDLTALDPSSIDRLNPDALRGTDPTCWAQALSAYLRGRIAQGSPDQAVREMVRAVQFGEDFDRSHLSARQLQRRFKTEVGISLKSLKSILRFRAVFDRLCAEENRSWAIRAMDAGYFDHPQLARDFKRYLGCSAREWVRNKGGLAKALASAPP